MARDNTRNDHPGGLTYRDAGVDIDAGAELIRRIGPAAARTRRPEMLAGLGGFAALTRLPKGYESPLLVTGTDGVGTKLRLAMDYDRHDRVGQDLVAMCVNDVLVTGGEPFLFLDYFATGKLQVDRAATVIEGIAAACELAGCTLAGGETAEMPGFYSDGDYDLAGFCVGIVEEAKVITGAAIAPGHQLLALPSSGPHSNGFSLIRRILEANPGCLDVAPERVAELLEPTAIYVKTILGLLKAGHPIDGMAHITGGGLPENLPRMLPKDSPVPLALAVDLASWSWPEPFPWLAALGNVAPLEMMKTFNCGVGFVLAVAADAAGGVEAALAAAGQPCWRLGTVVDGREAATPGTLHITAEGEGALA